MNRKHLYCSSLATAFCVFLLCLSGPLSAQSGNTPVGSLTNLQGRLVPGMDVTAIDNAGKKVHGKVTMITDTALVIENKGNKATYSGETLAEVRQRTQDSLLNGALIGAATGAAPIVILFAAAGDFTTSDYALFTAVFGGAGAGIGIVIDSLFKKEVVIYRNVEMSWAVGTPGRKHSPGLAFSMRW